jgi:hypothetical protein
MKKFHVKSVDYYLRNAIPPCSGCDCSNSIKKGKSPCPILDRWYLDKIDINIKEENLYESETQIDY